MEEVFGGTWCSVRFSHWKEIKIVCFGLRNIFEDSAVSKFMFRATGNSEVNPGLCLQVYALNHSSVPSLGQESNNAIRGDLFMYSFLIVVKYTEHKKPCCLSRDRAGG